MLIKIEAFPDAKGVVAKTLYVCLATANQETGAVCEIGRKVGDIVFPADKSVSRQHSTLRLISSDNNGGEGCIQPPRNDAERKACADSEYSMCCVLENAGKGGSYIAVEKQVIVVADDDSETDDGGKESDDETDDEGISQKPKPKSQGTSTAAASSSAQDIPALSTVVQQHWKGDKPVELLKMDPGDVQVLQFSKTNPTILVQCGRFEATLKLTLMRQVFGFSGISKTVQKDIRGKMHTIGALQNQPKHDSPPNEDTTHVITPTRIGAPKQLIAWCYNIPLVSPDFVYAFMDRRKADDPLPNPLDYEMEKKDDMDFWNTTANRNLLKDYTMLSVEMNDLEKLAVAAGAKSVALYDADDPQAVAQECIDKDGTTCFALNNRKKLTKMLKSLGVPLVSDKRLARTVSHQKAQELQDEHGNPIVVRVAPTTTTTTNKDEDETPTTSAEKSIKQEEEQQQELSSSSSRRIKSLDDSPPPQLDSIQTQPVSQGRSSRSRRQQESEPTESPATGKRTSPRKRRGEAATVAMPSNHEAEEEDNDEPQPPQRKRRRNAEPGEASQKETKSQTSSRSSRASRTSKPKETQPRESFDHEFPQEDPVEDEPMEDVPKEKEEKDDEPMEAPSLPKPSTTATKSDKPKKSLVAGADKSGWFTIAPKEDSLRKQLRKQAAQESALENGGISFLPAAMTKEVETLEQPSANARPSTSRSSKKGGPNFKRFRKNAIQKSTRIIPISLAAVMAKETQEQKRMDEQERALEEEQRLADELFRGDGLGMAKKKRRR